MSQTRRRFLELLTGVLLAGAVRMKPAPWPASAAAAGGVIDPARRALEAEVMPIMLSTFKASRAFGRAADEHFGPLNLTAERAREALQASDAATRSGSVT